ncbi:MAG: hypothetical protein COS68_04210 [Elusimicrobia bacterium CG06_land_8_20_14_3_00_38_11]|nr:MAG: hypothetical protein COS68_04210 [Elusimicrobia bacterium CG06_land_8_20_14_3_00_38_11]
MTNNEQIIQESMSGQIQSARKCSIPSESIPIQLKEQIKPGEHLLWHGKSRTELRGKLLLLIPGWVGGLFFGYFGVGLTWYHFKGSLHLDIADLVCVVFGILFILSSLFMILYPFYDRYQRIRTFYGVTDRRVIMVEEWPWHSVVTRDLLRLIQTRIVEEKPDGSGNIEFIAYGWGSTNSKTGDYPEFDFIRNVNEVHALILQARKDAVNNQSPVAKPELSGIVGKIAPDSIAWLAGVSSYVCAVFYPIVIWSDLKALSRQSWVGLMGVLFGGDQGSSVVAFCAAPIMMVCFYFRAKNFQVGTKAVRYLDVAVMAGFAILGSVLLFVGAATGNETGLYVVIGIVVLLATVDRD